MTSLVSFPSLQSITMKLQQGSQTALLQRDLTHSRKFENLTVPPSSHSVNRFTESKTETDKEAEMTHNLTHAE